MSLKIAIAYDFDGTLSPGNMQEHSFIPKLRINKDAFWKKENAIVICVDKKTQIQALDRKYTNKKLHVIADNLSIHKQKDVKEWLSRKRKITLHFTPIYSSWSNRKS